MTSSFKKKSSKGVGSYPRGTTPSLRNGQLITSTGVPAIDSLIGGGLPIGTTLVVEEDISSSYTNALVKYFLAEGAVCNHALCLASSSNQPESMLEGLPDIDDSSSFINTVDEPGLDKKHNMNIAWRYQNLPTVQSSTVTSGLGHSFDLGKVMPKNLISPLETYFFKNNLIASEQNKLDHNLNWNTINPVYSSLLCYISRIISEHGFNKTNSDQLNHDQKVLRICVSGLASPLWGCDGRVVLHDNPEIYDQSLLKFLIALKALLRDSYAVCMLTIPVSVFEDVAYLRRVEKISDTMIGLESYADSDKEINPLFRNYHGSFHIRKLPRISTLVSHIPDTSCLGFKLKRKKFAIEKMFLPPDLSETVSRAQEDAAQKTKLSACHNVGHHKSMDF
ncbi:Elongator complex protein 4 [Trichoplax sp. H2]|nr:Elongator complex protein 4 [Trichoplax sp. H2]|eukprot:RDD38973.1 Elongator complex protein 4 [Trichoplax sp. H2]